MADGIRLGYVSACIVGGSGDYDWMDKKVGNYFRNKYKSFDELTFAGIFLGAVEHGGRQAKQSSSNCEQMFDWILAIYKECGVNPQKIYDGRRGFLEKRKRILGY